MLGVHLHLWRSSKTSEQSIIPADQVPGNEPTNNLDITEYQFTAIPL